MLLGAGHRDVKKPPPRLHRIFLAAHRERVGQREPPLARALVFPKIAGAVEHKNVLKFQAFCAVRGQKMDAAARSEGLLDA